MTAAGTPRSTPAANASGHHHLPSTTANPESTTTTAPKRSSGHPKTRRYPIRSHRNRSDTTRPTSPRGTSIQARHPADQTHPTIKPPEPAPLLHLARPPSMTRALCQQRQDDPAGDGRRQHRVDAVHDAAVARKQRAHVLDAEVALDL